MRRDVLDLRAFYASPLGQAARTMLGAKIGEAWGGCANLDVLGLGYATPFLETIVKNARRAVAVSPAAQGVEVWPRSERNLAALADEEALPFAQSLFDRVLAVHALEEAGDPLRLMQEISRVLSPSGRAIVAVAARHGLWSHAEKTPFGHGRPYTRRQLETLLIDAELEPTGWTRALYVPPIPWAAGWAEGVEQVGAKLWPGFSGVILMEATKPKFALRSRGTPARARVFAPVLNPAGAPIPTAKSPASRCALGGKP
jgi:SAM-dependent methyltransferase